MSPRFFNRTKTTSAAEPSPPLTRPPELEELAAPTVQSTPEHLGAKALLLASVPDSEIFEQRTAGQDRFNIILDTWMSANNLELSPRSSKHKKFEIGGFTYLSFSIDASTGEHQQVFVNKEDDQFADIPTMKEQYLLLLDSSPTEGLALISRMDMDSAYPIDAGDAEDHVPLSPRPDDATNVINHGDKYHPEAKACGRAEGYFIEDKYNLREIRVDNEVIGLQKSLGENLVLTTRPTLLNGVRLPAGTILTAEQDEAGNMSFSYARLSLFALNNLSSIGVDYPYVPQTMRDKYQEFMGFMQDKLGKESANLPDNIQQIEERLQQIRERLSENVLLARGFEKLNQSALKMRREQKIFDKTLGDASVTAYKEERTLRAANVGYDDPRFKQIRKQKNELQSRLRSSKNPKVMYANSISGISRLYGPDIVNKALRLVAESEYLNRALADSRPLEDDL